MCQSPVDLKVQSRLSTALALKPQPVGQWRQDQHPVVPHLLDDLIHDPHLPRRASETSDSPGGAPLSPAQRVLGVLGVEVVDERVHQLEARHRVAVQRRVPALLDLWDLRLLWPGLHLRLLCRLLLFFFLRILVVEAAHVVEKFRK